MFGVKMQPIGRDNFFNSAAVIKRLSEEERKRLSRYGAFVRTDARQSIKPASIKNRKEIRAAKKANEKTPRPLYVPSKAGEPPRTRQQGAPIKRILFGYESASEAGNLFSGNVVIGFARLGGKESATPGRLEKGGEFKNRKGKTVKIAARPTMVPAQQRQMKRMPAMFADSL